LPCIACETTLEYVSAVLVNVIEVSGHTRLSAVNDITRLRVLVGGDLAAVAVGSDWIAWAKEGAGGPPNYEAIATLAALGHAGLDVRGTLVLTGHHRGTNVDVPGVVGLLEDQLAA
jgi:hypothetical protein